ncbi:hypothetical protein A1O7_07862 [Cladophialophora yegresii CBS 114405]|uniref:Mediator of RNA polymerase II transcription subunit 4 n=1 Tax=Cladophialophora yegresii CBS 114405 TaxID=1182544 RepID=W9WG64_9EURO|nr:uncharacterized protein A1O7_07862 [Cladophialophora yegresii CBS 114405]EXJ57514.1 hypothetical protein A1O7_07862 [Cladophialophora yegresii CBS 114405]
MDSLVLAPLDNIETHLTALISTLTQTNTFSNAPQLAEDLLADDNDLTSSLALLQRHQHNYARILSLREEVTSLQDQLKDTVRKCVAFKTEIGAINPAILQDDSEDEDEDAHGADHEGSVAEVDYHTLLMFAARIGKHNTIAAKEAETEAVRRKIAAKSGTVNGAQAQASITEPLTTQDTAGPDGEPGIEKDNNTVETTAELSRIDNAIAIDRARMGMAFPDGPSLRMGALGQLQLFRERLGQQLSSGGGGGNDDENAKLVQEAVEREVARMVRETEDIAPEQEVEEESTTFPESPVLGRREDPASGATRQPPISQGQAQRAPNPPQIKRKLDLDFPDSDDEEDD